MSLQARLLDPEPEDKETPAYVLIFPNVAEDLKEQEDSMRIPVTDARARLSLLLTSLPSAVRNTVQSQIPWASADFPSAVVPLRAFQRDCIQSVLWLLDNHCRMRTVVYKSRDEDELFCLIYPDESLLRTHAARCGYLVQVRPPRTAEKAEFMRVDPYIPFCEAVDVDCLKHYDLEGKEFPPGEMQTLFTPIDRIRITLEALATAVRLEDLKSCQVLKDHFPPHSDTQLQSLKPKVTSFRKIMGSPQHRTSLRNYFGERIALYFSWMGFYEQAMAICGDVGLLVYVLMICVERDWQAYVQVGFALFLAVWSTVFEQLWQRKQKVLSWKWGTIGCTAAEPQRAEYSAPPALDPVTGRMHKQRSSDCIRALKRTISVLTLLAYTALMVYNYSILYQFMVTSDVRYEERGIIIGVIIKIARKVYSPIANKLNKWENYETATQHESALSAKYFYFEFVNKYSPLYNAAFLQWSLPGTEKGSRFEEIGKEIAFVYLGIMVWNVMELAQPFVTQKLSIWLEVHPWQSCFRASPSARRALTPLESQAKCTAYSSPVGEYMEIITQYGYVALFAVTMPLVPLLAMLEIAVESVVDRIKLCGLVRRPPPERAEDIGVWFGVIRVVTFVGVTTNIALILFATDLFPLPLADKLILFIVLEHAFVGLKVLIAELIPDQPVAVTDGLEWAKHVALHSLKATS